MIGAVQQIAYFVYYFEKLDGTSKREWLNDTICCISGPPFARRHGRFVSLYAVGILRLKMQVVTGANKASGAPALMEFSHWPSGDSMMPFTKLPFFVDA